MLALALEPASKPPAGAGVCADGLAAYLTCLGCWMMRAMAVTAGFSHRREKSRHLPEAEL